MDDGIICGPDQKEIEKIIADLKRDFDLADEGDIKEYLGIQAD